MDAVRRLVLVSDHIDRVRLITASTRHAFVFFFQRGGPIAVKDGFTSGYRGAGPSALARALCILDTLKIELDEVEAPLELIKRLSVSALTCDDLEFLGTAEPVRPSRWFDYVYNIFGSIDQSAAVWAGFEPSIPFAALDQRLMTLGLRLRHEPDNVLLTGFRILEDRVRERTGLSDHGSKLFSRAFQGEESKLFWRRAGDEPIDPGEQTGRAQLFTGAYQAFRNPRAHRTPDDDLVSALVEFMVLNQLFRFEAEAVERPPTEVDPCSLPKAG